MDDKMYTVTLSICIPTYNRSAYLKECLISILESAKGYESQIAIIISDNDSTDDTMSVVKEFKRDYPWIQYHKNAQNIGSEMNFYTVASMAAGGYVWLFGDDDKMAREAIPTVLNKINTGCDVVICNYSLFSKDFKVKIKDSYKFKSDIISDHNALMKIFGPSLAFISSVIFKKNLLSTVNKDEYEKYGEYHLSFLYAIYCMVLNDCRLVYIKNPIVYQRAENWRLPANIWCKCFVTGFALIFEDLRAKGFSSGAVRMAKNKAIMNYILGNILNEKMNGRLPLDVYYRLSSHYKDCWMFWIICLPLLASPCLLVRIGEKIRKQTKKLRELLNHY